MSDGEDFERRVNAMTTEDHQEKYGHPQEPSYWDGTRCLRCEAEEAVLAERLKKLLPEKREKRGHCVPICEVCGYEANFGSLPKDEVPGNQGDEKKGHKPKR